MNMTPFWRLVFSSEAMRKITASIRKKENNSEAGGVLLGHRWLRSVYVVSATVPSEDETTSRGSFTIDGTIESSKARIIANSYYLKPNIIGIWHSHVSRIPQFSYQDIVSHKIMTNVLGTAISVLVIPTEKYTIEQFTPYLVTSKKPEGVIIDRWIMKDSEIPSILMKRK